MNIGELWIKLGIKADEKAIDSVNKSIRNLGSSLLKTIGLTVGTAGAVMALKRLSGTAMETAVAITNLSRKTGMSVEAIQRMQGSAVIVSQKEIQDINAANKEMYKLSVTGKSLAMIFGGEIAKSLGQPAKQVNKYLKENPRLIDQIRSVARGIGSLIVSTARLAKIIYEVIDRTVGWGRALRIVAGIWLGMKIVSWIPMLAGLITTIATLTGTIWGSVSALWGLAAALWASGIAPIVLAIAAAIGAMILTINDLWTFFTGGKSVFGEILKWIPKLVPGLDLIIKGFNFLKNKVKEFAPAVKDSFGKGFSFVKNKTKELGKAIKDNLLKNFNAIKNSSVGKFFRELGGNILAGVIEHLKIIWQLLGNIGKLFLSLVKFDKEGISEAVSGLKNNTTALTNNVLNTTKNVVGTVGRAVNNVSTSVINNFNGNANKDMVDKATQKTINVVDNNFSQYKAMQPAVGY
ncbi:hypothetical protein NO1_1934 [Candidatus Termititenax aidoneus]|uniref:Phage tail tape measure protein n=1 Tax=Termititenax aidoneus TaxID=2218524 RepID=A0A388TDZ8_TERA1|nr:hypothetical protein NO1_1934 [Candidatus Termititenax aidoneus]